jgi:cardiolipin synthase
VSWAGWDLFVPGRVLLGVFLASQLIALLTIPSVLLRRRGRPSAALSWLLALFALPLLGVLAWWAFGRTHLERKRRRRARKKRAFARVHSRHSPDDETIFDRQLPARARRDCVFPSPGNRLTLLLDGERAYAAMESAIQGARESVHILMYIWQDDATGRRIRDLLAEKARQGIRVRVLVDGFGSSGFARRLGRPLREAGASVAVFLPSRFTPLESPRTNFVNHRKILVVDDRVAFTGGMNVGDEYAQRWRDAMVRIEGPAVQDLQLVFLDDWYFATNELVETDAGVATAPYPDGVDAAIIASGPDSEAWIHDAYFLALTQAQQRIWIATPYFIPGPAILAALRTAAGRGVDVRIVVPSNSDVALVAWASRSFYRMLLQAGVRIFEYGGTMLHAKALVTDDNVGSIGTANIDSRSFRLSFEVGCFFASKELNQELASWHEGLTRGAIEVTREAIAKKPLAHKLAESVAHLCSPLL